MANKNNNSFFSSYFPTFFGLGSLVSRGLAPAVGKVSGALRSNVASGKAPGGKSTATRGGRGSLPSGSPNGSPDLFAGSSLTGQTATASPSIANFQRGLDRGGRMDGIAQDWQLYNTDPRLSAAVQMTAWAAVKAGFWYKIEPKKGVGAKVGKSASQATDAMLRRTGLVKRNGKVNRARMMEWLLPAMVEGDAFIQRVALDKDLIGMEYMPAATMERLSNNADQFEDVDHAFAQFDLNQNRADTTFALWQIDHHRWMRIGGDRYGQPGFKQTRQAGRELRLQEESQTIRRIDNSAFREHHQVGNPDEQQDATALDEYEKDMGFDGENARRSADPYEQNTRYVTSGNVTISRLASDPNVHEVDDLKWAAQKFAVGLHYPLQLLGYGMEGLSRDELSFIKEQWQEYLEYAQDFILGIILNAIELQLILAGIDPDSLDITLESTPLTTATLQDTIATITKALSATLGAGMSAIPFPLLTPEQIAHLLKQHGLAIDDVDDWMEALEKMKKQTGTDADTVHERNMTLASGGAGNIGVQNGSANSKSKPGGATTGYGGDRPSGSKSSGEGYKAVIK